MQKGNLVLKFNEQSLKLQHRRFSENNLLKKSTEKDLEMISRIRGVIHSGEKYSGKRIRGKHHLGNYTKSVSC